MPKEPTYKLLNPELEAEIYYLTSEEWGRSTPVHTGYRGQFHYDGGDWDAAQEFVDKEVCNPGEIVKVRLETTGAPFHIGKFWVGKEFETREGARVVGRGKITKVLRPGFNYWDYNSFFQDLPRDCKPYNQENLDGFIEDCLYDLRYIERFKNIEFIINLDDKRQMLTIKGNLHRSLYLIGDLAALWNEKLALKHSLFKANYDYLIQFAFIFLLQ